LKTWMSAGPTQSPGVVKPEHKSTETQDPVTESNSGGKVQAFSETKKRSGCRSKKIWSDKCMFGSAFIEGCGSTDRWLMS
jgi:hypothetical protein